MKKKKKNSKSRGTPGEERSRHPVRKPLPQRHLVGSIHNMPRTCCRSAGGERVERRDNFAVAAALRFGYERRGGNGDADEHAGGRGRTRRPGRSFRVPVAAAVVTDPPATATVAAKLTRPSRDNLRSFDAMRVVRRIQRSVSGSSRRELRRSYEQSSGSRRKSIFDVLTFARKERSRRRLLRVINRNRIILT